MAHDSVGSKNQPHYAGGGIPADAADLTEIADYAAKVGNRRSDLASVRTALTGADLWSGLEFFESDTGAEYVYQTGGWVFRGYLDSGWIAATYASGWGDFNAGTFGVFAYRRRASKVSLRGVPFSSNTLTLITTLPVGYRPPYALQFDVNKGGAFQTITIQPTGTVTADGTIASGQTISLGEVEFSIN